MKKTQSRIYLVCIFGLLSAFSLFGIVGCVTHIPVDEYNIARAAYRAANEADAARFAPGLWFNAEQSYREAEKAFRERRYPDAKKLFAKAQEMPERAEETARLARYQSGEIVP